MTNITLAPARDRYRARKDELEIDAKKSLGQNFLVSDNVIQKILDAAALLKPESVIEVGPGLGALTDGLLQLQKPLSLIELDSKFATYWGKQGLDVTEGDALQLDWKIQDKARPCIFVSNLPYQISSSIVIERCLDPKPLDAMILMFQKEVAQRLRATLRDEPYGFLSVMAQTFWKMETVVDASPRDFDPAPKIASRVLLFRPLPPRVENPRRYLKFLKACFLHPRKYLLSNLAEGGGRPKDELKKLFDAMNLDPQVRGDQLSVDKFLELFYLFEEVKKA